jgi:hypothetical protein
MIFSQQADSPARVTAGAAGAVFTFAGLEVADDGHA